MRFLVDQPVSPTVADWLRRRGHDAIHVRDRRMSAAHDADLVKLAIAESRVIVTSDLDYPRILALGRMLRPALVLFRAGNLTDTQMVSLMDRVLSETTPESLVESVIVVDEYSIRIARLPLK